MSRLATLRATLAALADSSPRGAELRSELDRLRLQLGGVESRQVRDLGSDEIDRAEFQVFSQFGEDGIVQFLVQRVPVEQAVFVEFGVEDYRESNTRFLLIHDNWRGLIIDAGTAHRDFLRSSGLAWRHEIDAVSAFIDRDNIDGLIRSAGIEGDVGLLSIDLDGNDYWILEAIQAVSPRILVLEYNSTFGPEAAVTVPYDREFVRSEKHYSLLYWGASLAALTRLAEAKGYGLVGGNRAGNNAFFVRRDLLGEIPQRPVAEVWRPSRFRESRDPSGALDYVGPHEARLALIRALPVVDVESGRETTIEQRFGL